jgi:hypothetical protein
MRAPGAARPDGHAGDAYAEAHGQAMAVLDEEGEGHFDPFVHRHFVSLLNRHVAR